MTTPKKTLPRDLTGMVFGRLTVLGFSHYNWNWVSYWRCKCECGREKSIRKYALTCGTTLSCGCLHNELSARRGVESAERRGITQDITGMKFNRLTVLGRDGTHKFRLSTFLCVCECGQITSVSRQALKTGSTKSCGCLANERAADISYRAELRSGIPRDLTGQTFERLTVLRCAGIIRRVRMWECACQCGKITLVSRSCLVRGTTRSCGCLQKEFAGTHSFKHGQASTKKGVSRTYQAWQNMRTRCHNPNTAGWKNYGGRGISICPEWDNFETFLFDMGECPQTLTLERVDVNGNYSASNCIWATQQVQNNNKRKTECCRHGHSRQENTSVTARGKRYCKLCAQDWKRNHKSKVKQESICGAK